MLRIAIVWEEAFPTLDALSLTLGALRTALDGLDATVLGARDLARLPGFDLLILPFGSAFPKESWPEIALYLEGGGNLLSLGGIPFAVPCNREHVVWAPEVRQTQYHDELGIRLTGAIAGERIDSLQVPEEEPILAGLAEPLRGRGAFAFSFTSPRTPERAARRRVRPLLYALDAAGARIAAPVVALDHLEDRFSGGRWVLAPIHGEMPLDLIRRLAFFAVQGASDFTASPAYACYDAGEQPQFAIHAGQAGTLRGPRAIRLSVTDPSGARCECEVPGVMDGHLSTHRWVHCASCPAGRPPRAPGFHRVEAVLVNEEARALAAALPLPAAARAGEEIRRSAFWVRGDTEPAAGPGLLLSSAGFQREGAPSPLLGTTYTGADFASPLAEPDPYRWERDFQAMSRAGLALVRTGIWRAVSEVMGTTEPPDEACLRALDALVLTARRHNLMLLLAPFAAAGASQGLDSYLDPHAAEAQNEWLTTLVERCGRAPEVLWDLLDTLEAGSRGDTSAPAAPSPSVLWRPDEGETTQQAWLGWAADRSQEALREAWRLTPCQSLALPGPTHGNAPSAPSPWNALKALDYRRFAAEKVSLWLSELQTTIRLQTGSDPLVSAGPVRVGGMELEPARLANSVDFTVCPAEGCLDPLADVARASASGKPALLGALAPDEAETPSGEARFGEEDERNRLEQAVVLSVVVGCAGAIPWPWQAGAQGARPGLLRADGSRHPSLDALAEISGFLARNHQRLAGREPETALLLLPDTAMHYERDPAMRAVSACLRACCTTFLLPVRAVGEGNAAALAGAPLALLPSPRVLSRKSWDALMQRVSEGTTLVVTGPIDDDDYWRPCGRLAALGLSGQTRPVAREESFTLDGREMGARFEAIAGSWPEKVVIAGHEAEVISLAHGKGHLIWSPLPLELASAPAPLAALYGLGAITSGLVPPYATAEPVAGVLVRGALFRDAALYAFVSETGVSRTLTLLHGVGRVPLSVTVPAQRSVLLLVERETAQVVDRYL